MGSTHRLSLVKRAMSQEHVNTQSHQERGPPEAREPSVPPMSSRCQHENAARQLLNEAAHLH